MSRKEGGGEGVRVFKQIETNDMVETRVKLAKELDDRTAGWLDHSSQVMAEIEGVSKQEMEMAKYMHG
jgi:CRP-like cAMP-binding protein